MAGECRGRAGRIRTHRDLAAWQRAIELAEAVYLLTERLPDSERWGLVSQLRRAAVSIPSNVAEGAARGRRREFLNSLRIARGSLAEVETQLRIIQNRGWVPDLAAELRRVDQLERILNGLIAALCRPPPIRTSPAVTRLSV